MPTLSLLVLLLLCGCTYTYDFAERPTGVQTGLYAVEPIELSMSPALSSLVDEVSWGDAGRYHTGTLLAFAFKPSEAGYSVDLVDSVMTCTAADSFLLFTEFSATHGLSVMLRAPEGKPVLLSAHGSGSSHSGAPQAGKEAVEAACLSIYKQAKAWLKSQDGAAQ